MNLQRSKQRCVAGPAGVAALLQIAFPMIISQASETVMMFVDRLFLARLGREYLAAAMAGGLTAFTCLTFFFGIIGYTNALVAQYYGAGRRRECGTAVAQALLISVACYPVILALTPLAIRAVGASGHDAAQQALECEYFRILLYGSILALTRVSFSTFFSGIGRTRTVMVANLAAMVANVIANYALIFGHLGFPALRMAGAAWGTVFGGAVGTAILAWAYFRRRYRETYGTVSGLRWHFPTFKTLVYYGYPSGIEFFLNLAAFTMFIQLFQSYGRDVAAAVTITFNWDLVAFVPNIGINIATMSLVGRFMGARKPALAKRAACSGLTVAYAYSGVLMLLFLGWPEALVGVFAAGANRAEYARVVPLATPMLRLAAVYTLSDATYLVFGGALRGAGDTRWAMRASVLLHWLIALSALTLIRGLQAAPLVVWMVFVAEVALIGIVFWRRFRSGRWTQIDAVPPPAPETPQPLDAPPPPEIF